MSKFHIDRVYATKRRGIFLWYAWNITARIIRIKLSTKICRKRKKLYVNKRCSFGVFGVTTIIAAAAAAVTCPRNNFSQLVRDERPQTPRDNIFSWNPRTNYNILYRWTRPFAKYSRIKIFNIIIYTLMNNVNNENTYKNNNNKILF